MLHISLNKRHRLANEGLVNLMWDSGCELGSPAPHARCNSLLYVPEYFGIKNLLEHSNIYFTERHHQLILGRIKVPFKPSTLRTK